MDIGRGDRVFLSGLWDFAVLALLANASPQQALQALEGVVDDIYAGIANGSLRPYPNRSVTIVQ